MIKELYQQTIKITSLIAVQSKIEAVMKKNITKSGCRIYHDGLLGIAGTLGEPTPLTWAEAAASLDKKISYPFEPEKNKTRSRDLREAKDGEEAFIRETEELLAKLRQEHPDFIFSNKIKMIETEVTLQNEAGLHYTNRDLSFEAGLLVKHVDSLNIFDTVIASSSRVFDQFRILREAGEMLSGYKKQAQLPGQEKMKVVIQQDALLSKVSESLNGETVGLGTSLFCDKIGTKAFGDSLRVYQDRTAEKHHTPFFDMEGVVNPGDLVMLIENGIILKPYTDKKQAAAFSFSHTGAAGGTYDGVPSLGYANLTIKQGEQTLQQLLDGEYGIMVIMASGGDYTNEGNFATPVQMAYLTDGKHLLGRLPELNLSGNIYEIFGKDFIGLSKDKPLMGERALVVKMNV